MQLLLSLKYSKPELFYIHFNELKNDIELAKWGVLNHAPESFYMYFDAINHSPSPIKRD